MTRLTDRSIEALKPRSARYEVWDEARKGFGIRVTPRGVKSFVWVYHFRGKPRRLTFGTYPRLSLADAGLKLAQAKRQLDLGADPGEQVVAERVAARHAETVAELVEEYLARYARLRKRSAAEDERILRKDILPRWGVEKAAEITQRHVVRLVNEIVDRGAPIQANRTLTILRRMFRFGVGQAIITSSPCDSVETPSAENQRDRVLSDDEIRTLWNALDDAPMEPNVGRILRMMLITGQRKAEVVGLHRNEIDFDRSLWTLPAARAKNGREHLIPLPHLALQLLAEANPCQDGHLFPSRLTGLPYRGQSIDHATRYLFDPRPRKAKRHSKSIGQPVTPLLAGKIDRFVPHDLRRTVATRMRELGISRGDVKMVLNHVESDVTARYDRYDGLAEKKRALHLWGARLAAIVAGKLAISNVIELAHLSGIAGG
jgi:integrase